MKIISHSKLKLFFNIGFVLIYFFISIKTDAQWIKTGFNTASNIGIFQICSKDETILLSTGNSTASGIFRSEDGGINWDMANNGIETDNGLISPQKIVAGKTNNNFYCLILSDIYMTNNNGDDWVKISEWNLTGYVSDIETDYSGNLVICTESGVLKSSNNGVSWIDMNFGESAPFEFVQEIEIDKLNNIYAVGSDPNRDRIYKFDIESESISWPATPILPSGKLIRQFKINSQGKIVLFDYSNNLFVSNNSGTSWTEIPSFSTYSYFIKTLIVDPSDNIFVDLNNDKILKSDDDGNSWNTIYTGSVDDIFVESSGNIYANLFNSGTSNGTIVSSDKGSNWEVFNYLSVPVSALSTGSSGKIFAASSQENKGLYFSQDKGNTWSDFNIQDIVYSAQSVDCNGSGRIVFCDQYRVHYSKNLGNDWTTFALGTGNSNNVVGAIITPDNIVFAGGHTIGYTSSVWLARSENDGQSWEYLNSGGYQSLKKIVFSEKNNSVFAFTGNYGRPGMGGGSNYIIRSTDKGNNWEEVFDISNTIVTINFEWIVSLSCHPDGTIFVSSDKSLYRSTDNGDSWSKIDSLAEHAGFKNFVFNTYGYIYASNDNGIFCSTDLGITWANIDSDKQVTAMAIDSDNFLYIGTSQQGIYRSNLPLTDVKSANNIPINFILEQNYPNPFNPSTKISYSIPEYENVKIILYDMLGRKVRTLLNEYKPAGIYEIEFYADNLSSGVYIYTLQAGEFIQTRKMLLLK